MLNDAEKKKFDHIVAWQGPQEFKVHDRTLFEKLVLPTYFQIRFKSFQRQRKYEIVVVAPSIGKPSGTRHLIFGFFNLC